jgi:isocitrate dehydrogenase (NAD+)
MTRRTTKPPRRAAFISGDGIGPEVTWAARRCVDASGAAIEWVDCPVGADRLIARGTAIPPETAAVLLESGIVLKGPLEGSAPSFEGNPNTMLEHLYGVFASLRPCRSFPRPGESTPGFDVLVIAQRAPVASVDSASPKWAGLRGITSEGASAAVVADVNPAREREFFDFAFAQAIAAGRRRVTLVHRANVHRTTDGAWLRLGEEVARRHPGMACEDQLVDHVAMQIARAPERFDTLVVTPLYGEIVGDIAVGLAGGLGLVPEVLAGRRGTIFTTVHGTAPRFAGLGRASPCAMILAAAALLRACGDAPAAAAIEAGVEGTLATPDLAVDTGVFVDKAIERIRLAPLPRPGLR